MITQDFFNWMQIIPGAIGMITGIVGMVTGLKGIQHTKAVTIDKFFSALESKDFIKVKKIIYNKDVEDVSDEDAAVIVNFYHHWGLMVKKKYLPIWAFDGGTGDGVVRSYERVRKYIELRREHDNNKTYAIHFEWLYKELLKKS